MSKEVAWLDIESELTLQGYTRIAGLDEAGCGPLAGPVVAACVILPVALDLPGLRDSKKLSSNQREKLYAIVEQNAEYGIGMASPAEIDALNIRQATYLAMSRALDNLIERADYLLVDCWTLPQRVERQLGITKGDAKVRSIAAASVIAKVTRDRLMVLASVDYPQYGFSQHKGYPTQLHYRMLAEHGSSPLHRQSFLGKIPSQMSLEDE